MTQTRRPGWPEIVVGLTVLVITGVGGGAAITAAPISPVDVGLLLTGLSGVAGLAGFFAAVLLRIRTLEPFGLQPTTTRWLGIAAGLGAATFVAKGLAMMAWVSVTGDDANIQAVYAAGAGGGLVTVLIATVLLGLLTPVGEELLFRGVVTSALLRYGPWIGVGASSLIFALIHGVNIVFPAALVTGIVAGEVFRRSGSIWPAIIVHVVVNLPTIPVMVLAGLAA